MCGIIGYIGAADAVPLVVEGLRRLEYRGYDSAGIAVVGQGGFDVVKRKGRLSVLEQALRDSPLSGHAAIGHTRWATHGEPSDLNSHPHLGSRGQIAVVHNGIIENYKQLREQLQQQGVSFASDTDTEVIAQLAEHYYTGDLLDTVIRVLGMLEGSYALGVLCVDCPDRMIAVKKDNPLIIGAGRDGSFIASDVPAVLPHTSSVYYLADREIAVLEQSSVTFFDLCKEPIPKTPEEIAWGAESAEKGGYPHFMLKEIMEQPRVLRDAIHSTRPGGKNAEVLESLEIGRYDKLVITACGSAYNAGMVGRVVIEQLCRLPVEVELASEFRYRDPIVDAGTLVVLVSQSGETADTIAALREAKRKGATTLSLVNVVGSTIAKESDHTLYIMAGPEIAVATTKAFSAQLVLLYLVAVSFATQLGRLAPGERDRLLWEIESLPEKAEKLLAQPEQLRQYAATCVDSRSVFFIGRGIDYAIAQEGSLKLKEISYIHSEAYAGGELKHGTISLIEENTLVVAISCCQRLAGKLASNIEQVVSRGARVLCITTLPPDTHSPKLSYLTAEPVCDLFSPSLSVIVLQLLAYYIAADKGLDIDKPRNLAKSVTVE